MKAIDTIEALEAFYIEKPGGAAVEKVTDRLTRAYHAWIMASRFCVISTVGPEGTDGSPRGDDGPVVRVLDAKTLALPDWRGNKRLDTLRNIVRDGRVSLMFFVPGSGNVMRVNGRAVVTADQDLCASFAQHGKTPKSVIVVTISEVYPQCARAIMRSGLWTSGDRSDGLPTVGEMLKDVTNGAFDGAAYDAEWSERADKTMW